MSLETEELKNMLNLLRNRRQQLLAQTGAREQELDWSLGLTREKLVLHYTLIIEMVEHLLKQHATSEHKETPGKLNLELIKIFSEFFRQGIPPSSGSNPKN